MTYTGAPDECSRCWPHKIHEGSCETDCPPCGSDAIKRQLHPSQRQPGISREKPGKADAPIIASGPSKLPGDFPGPRFEKG